jgi:hypothetical protein
LYERYPNKSFYLLCDDDTFIIPANLLRLANRIDPNKFSVSGKSFTALSYADQYSGLSETQFSHGGSGQLMTGALMRLVGPQLRKCSRVFGIPNTGSDIRLAMCIARTRLPRNNSVHRDFYGFNAESPDVEMELLSPGLQYSFHKVANDLTDLMFKQMLTPVDGDSYFDWSPIIFRLVRFDSGGKGRSFFAVFGHLICTEIPLALRMRAVGGIVPSRDPFANFTQDYGKGFQLFLRCKKDLANGEIAYFGEPPPPRLGVIVEVKCPPLSRFREMAGVTRVTYEEGSYL